MNVLIFWRCCSLSSREDRNNYSCQSLKLLKRELSLTEFSQALKNREKELMINILMPLLKTPQSFRTLVVLSLVEISCV